jgi:hypothetical protein
VGSNNRFTKDPDAVVDFGIPWAEWLGTDTISAAPNSCTWLVPTGITSVLQTNTTTAAWIWLSGGTVGTEYALCNRIVTAGGRTQDQTIYVIIEER